MKAEDLRIGNWVAEKGDAYEITSITRNGQLRLFVAAENHTSGVSKINPIPLTSEWFDKWGCTKDSDYKHAYFIGDYNVILHEDGWFVYMNNEYEICHLKYVHEAQNFYFGIYKKEIGDAIQ